MSKQKQTHLKWSGYRQESFGFFLQVMCSFAQKLMFSQLLLDISIFILNQALRMEILYPELLTHAKYTFWCSIRNLS